MLKILKMQQEKSKNGKMGKNLKKWHFRKSSVLLVIREINVT